MSSTVNPKRLKLNGALYATYNFDNAERLSNIVNASDSSTISFGYDNEGKLTSRVYPNGVTTTYEYFDDDTLKRLKDFTNSATLFNCQYTYNSANQISSITELSGTRTILYDDVDRLTSVNSGAESYTYDFVGNRISNHAGTYGYPTAPHFNRVTSFVSQGQPTSYGYDANGNTTTKSEGSNFWRYGWDHENRMVTASTRKQSVRYKYDALGRRIERNFQFGRERTKFTYDGDDVLLDDNAGTLTKYLNGEGIDNKLRSQTGTAENYFLADHLGSTNGLADLSGAITSQTGYDSFGNPSNAAFTSRYQFTGREFDSFTGLQFSRARFYDPKLGRFISEDPIGLNGGDINLYGYVKNNTINKKDPLGLIDPSVHQDPRIYDIPAACRGHAPPYIPLLAETGLTGNSCIDQGWRAEASHFANGDPLGRADIYGGAYRHCVASCYLRRRYGPFGGIARSIWDYVHENANDQNSQGDMAGENAGESVARGCGSCEDGCLAIYPKG